MLGILQRFLPKNHDCIIASFYARDYLVSCHFRCRSFAAAAVYRSFTQSDAFMLGWTHIFHLVVRHLCRSRGWKTVRWSCVGSPTRVIHVFLRPCAHSRPWAWEHLQCIPLRSISSYRIYKNNISSNNCLTSLRKTYEGSWYFIRNNGQRHMPAHSGFSTPWLWEVAMLSTCGCSNRPVPVKLLLCWCM